MKTYSLQRGGLRILDPFVPVADGESSASFFRIAYLPGISVIPMIQHSGGAARLLVEPGELVHEGMLIGRSEGKGSAHVHAPVSGKVLKKLLWRMPDGRSCQAIVLRMQGAFTLLGKRRETWAAGNISPHELKRVIMEKGLIDMEGAGAPLNELVANFRSRSQGASLLFNALFDDPWQAANRHVAHTHPAAMISALSLLSRATGIQKIYCAIAPEEKSLARSLVEEAVSADLPFELVYCRRVYPLGVRRELENLLARNGKGSPFSKQAGSGGYFCLGASSLLAIHEALAHNVPLLERHVAVGGSAVKYPGILRIRLGTRIGDAIAECGGFVDEPRRIVLNSLLTGLSVGDLDTPITKTVSAIIVEGAGTCKSVLTSPCSGCGECRAVCPRSLDPELLYRLMARGLSDEARREGLEDCLLCNACSIVCPSHIPVTAAWSRGIPGGSDE